MSNITDVLDYLLFVRQTNSSHRDLVNYAKLEIRNAVCTADSVSVRERTVVEIDRHLPLAGVPVVLMTRTEIFTIKWIDTTAKPVRPTFIGNVAKRTNSFYTTEVAHSCPTNRLAPPLTQLSYCTALRPAPCLTRDYKC